MDTIMDTPMRKPKLEEKVTPTVKGEVDRDAICHFLDLVHGHDSSIESWLNQAGLATYEDLLTLACDLEFLKAELLIRFENDNKEQIRLSAFQRARIMAYFKALKAEEVDTAEASMFVGPSHLTSAMKGQSRSPISRCLPQVLLSQPPKSRVLVKVSRRMSPTTSHWIRTASSSFGIVSLWAT